MFFTDKMPENCVSCPCADGEYGVCNIDYSVGLSADDRPKECPLREVKHAHWSISHWIMPRNDDGMSDPIYYQVRCSKCGFGLDPQTWVQELQQYGADKYCPKCGAKMNEDIPADIPMEYFENGGI